tara:strand:+ start:1679 stop:1807 length:129 start_codon:yes stop_codon:yes gene_type:complete
MGSMPITARIKQKTNSQSEDCGCGCDCEEKTTPVTMNTEDYK